MSGQLFTRKEGRQLFYALLLGSILFGTGIAAIAAIAAITQNQQCEVKHENHPG